MHCEWHARGGVREGGRGWLCCFVACDVDLMRAEVRVTALTTLTTQSGQLPRCLVPVCHVLIGSKAAAVAAAEHQLPMYYGQCRHGCCWLTS
jgi:hypothetical protein